MNAHGGTAGAGIGSGYVGGVSLPAAGTDCDAVADPGTGQGISDTTAITIRAADVIADAGCASGGAWATALGGGAGAPGAALSIEEGSEIALSAPGSASTIGGGSGAESEFGSFTMELGGEVSISEGSTLMVPEQATVANGGMIWIEDPFTNRGTIASTGGVFAFGGVVNHGLIVSSYSLLISGEPSENHGTIVNTGELAVFSDLLNHGVIRGGGELEGLEHVLVHRFLNDFDPNGGASGGSGSALVLAPSFAAAQHPLPDPPARAGFDFVGWNSASDGSGLALEAETVLGASPATRTWFAQWRAHAAPDPGPAPPPAPAPGPEPDPTPVSDRHEVSELADGGASASAALMSLGCGALFVLGGTVALVSGTRRRS